MINFTLPHFYYNFKINNFFTKLSITQPELFYKPVSFTAVSGQFPYCYWNGGFNTNLNSYAFYYDFINCVKESVLPVRFNCSNIYLQDIDFFDTMGNLILQLNEDYIHSIEISNIKFYQYLKEKYPKYNFVFSKDANYISEFSQSIIDTILDSNDFSLLQLPIDYKNLENIDNKQKIELTAVSACADSCSQYHICRLHEHQAQYNYSNKNNYEICKKRKITTIIPLSQIEEYTTKGFNHFYIDDATFLSLLEYFIPKENWGEVLNLAKQEDINI